MKFSKLKLNILLLLSVITITIVVVSTDDYTLNSIAINYDDNFVINEINTAKTVTQLVQNNTQATLINNVANTNNWIFPVSGNYTITTYYSSSHKAIDIYSYAGHGAPILAANNGTVISVVGGCIKGDASCNGRRGNYIVINHNNNNYYTVYMHLDKINVTQGQNVTAGQIIATMGNTGQVIPLPTAGNPYGGTHLHFCVFIGEPYKGGYAINPFNLY